MCARVLLLCFCVTSGHAATPERPLMRDFIGINGHTVQFKPELYKPAASLVRDYHPVEWDLGRGTSEPAPFPFAKNRVDWNAVYGSWKRAGWTTNACLMFESIPRDGWTDLERDARAYGESFAREFGPSGARRLVESVEIGNEPGKWSDADYTTIFRAMAAGIRAGDPRMKIATCNLSAGKSGDYEKSVDCVAGARGLVDVLTIHSYAQLVGWPTWKRSFPEDPALPRYLKDITDLCEWRDRHMPGKPVWITEFGYDSTTRPQEKTGDFAKWEGVSDTRQAQWLVRSLLLFSAMPVERAYIYFFNDEDKASLHASSGLTRHFKPKPSFHAVSHMRKVLGDFRFSRIVANVPGEARVHEYVADGKPDLTVWLAWSPALGDTKRRVELANAPGALKESFEMPLADGPAPAGAAREVRQDTVEVEVGGSPTYLVFKKADAPRSQSD